MKLEPTTILAITAVIQVFNIMLIGREYYHKKWSWMSVWCFFAGVYTSLMIEIVCKILRN